jgi:hypothetical protein
MVHLLVAPLAANYALQGRGVFIVPSIGIDPATLRENILVYGTQEDWLRYARIIVGESLKTPEDPSNIIHVEGENWKEDMGKVLEASRKLIAQTGHPNLALVSVDTLVSLYGENNCLEILNLNAARARRAGAAVIALVRAGSRELAIKLSTIADLYLRLKREHGCLLLYGVKPRIGLYAVEADTSKGYPIPKLTPIV